MSGTPSTSSSESSLRIYGPLVPFEDETHKSNLDFGYAPQNRRHARRPSRGLVGLWKDVTRKLRKPERASVLPPGFELVAEQRRRSKMLQQIAERNPRLVALPHSNSTPSRSPSLSTSSSRSDMSAEGGGYAPHPYSAEYPDVVTSPVRPFFLEGHQRSASYPVPVLLRTPRKTSGAGSTSGYSSPPRSASLYRSEWYE
ncbi:unnamed protein product [Peniophora sp. CBMAI 1063]|nr:unnamed protein product [Peniophora sp. CBMAI 1063]